MGERVKAQLAGWAVGLITAVAISCAAWSMKTCVALGSESARQKQEVQDMRGLLEEVRADVKELMRRVPQK